MLLMLCPLSRLLYASLCNSGTKKLGITRLKRVTTLQREKNNQFGNCYKVGTIANIRVFLGRQAQTASVLWRDGEGSNCSDQICQ